MRSVLKVDISFEQKGCDFKNSKSQIEFLIKWFISILIKCYAFWFLVLRYERQLAYINQEMENECVEMQEDAPEEFTDDCCGRWDVLNLYLP